MEPSIFYTARDMMTGLNLPLAPPTDQSDLKKFLDKAMDNGMTLLHYAVLADNKSVVQKLIDQGANVNACDNNFNTPLHYVKSVDVARMLIDKKADINVKNSYGDDFLRKTLLDKNIDLLTFLLEQKLVKVEDLRKYYNLPTDCDYKTIIEIIRVHYDEDEDWC